MKIQNIQKRLALITLGLAALSGMQSANAGIRDYQFDGIYTSRMRTEQLTLTVYNNTHQVIGRILTPLDLPAHPNAPARMLTTDGGSEVTLNRNLLPLLGESPWSWDGPLGKLIAMESLDNPSSTNGLQLTYRGGSGLRSWPAEEGEIEGLINAINPELNLSSKGTCRYQTREVVDVRMSSDFKSAQLKEAREHLLNPDRDRGQLLACAQLLRQIRAAGRDLSKPSRTAALSFDLIAEAQVEGRSSGSQIEVLDPITDEEFSQIRRIRIERSVDLRQIPGRS